ncbi:hypothetical protein MZH97_003506 [Salmonella enterica]|nr:hypothetical protein [Salmonella enterica]
MTITAEELKRFKSNANFDIDRPASLDACNDYFSACGLLLAHIEFLTAKIADMSNDRGQLLIAQKTLINQATLIAEKQAVIDQRNGECDRLINELGALREQKPVAYSYCYAMCETCEGFQDWRDELSNERPPEWMLETGKVTELQELFTRAAPLAVVTLPNRENIHNGFDTQQVAINCTWNSAIDACADAIRAAGGKVAE